jgi:hypothetical protein
MMQFNRASMTLRRTVGVHVDCRRTAGSSHPAGERSRPTVIRQDKRRTLRPGRTVEEQSQINNFVRGALWHRTSSLRASYWKAETTCTLRASTWCTGTVDRSVAPRTIRPFCPGEALWRSAAMDCPRVRCMSIALSPLGCALDLIAEGGA